MVGIERVALVFHGNVAAMVLRQANVVVESEYRVDDGEHHVL